MNRLLLICLLATSLPVSAIVIRHDVDDAQYRATTAEFPALVDLPGEGHGVLIARQWVVTAAHAVTWQSEIKTVELNGKARNVDKVIVHSGYKKLPQELIDQAIRTSDATRIVDFLASQDDIALIKLTTPVSDVAPATLFSGNNELGQSVELIGKGATGTGLTGQGANAPHRTDLRHAQNKIVDVDVEDRWICYVFDKPPAGVALEGISGDGDSGGPVLMQVEGQWQVAGLASWKKHAHDNALVRDPGVYGQKNYNVRVSHYRKWIDDQMGAKSSSAHGG
jgi:secreted trypsin-like serine protease